MATGWGYRRGRSAPCAWRIARLLGHTGQIGDASFSPDGASVVTVSYDGSARIWDAGTDGLVIDHADRSGFGLLAARFIRDGRQFVTGGYEGRVRLWDSETGALLQIFPGELGEVQAVAASRDGRRVAAAGFNGSAWVWNTRTGLPLTVIRRPGQQFNGVALSPDGRSVFVESNRSSGTGIFDALTGKTAVPLQEPAGGEIAAFSPDGGLALGAGAGPASVWDASTGRLLHKLDADFLTVASFSPNGRSILTAGFEGVAKIWDAGTGRLLHTLRGHAGPIVAGAFSPDGDLIATGGEDKTARIWSTATGKQLAELSGSTEPVTSVSFGPDGKWLMTASGGSVRVWQAPKGTAAGELSQHSRAVIDIAFSPLADRVLIGDANGTAEILRCEACASLERLLQLARGRVTRQLTPSERKQYLHQS